MTAEFQLPNNEVIHHLNDYETAFLYQEIFVEQVYLKHGIELSEEAVILDLGANIGLFSLFIQSNYPTATVYALEPSPITFPLLQANFQLNNKVITLPLAADQQEGKTEFTAHQGYSVISGQHSEFKKDLHILLTGSSPTPDQKQKTQQVISRRLNKKITTQVNSITLSKLIQQYNLDTIDLIKMDIEGNELAALQGLDKKDWSKIKQLVIEVHSTELLNSIIRMLRQQGFMLTIEKDKNLAAAGITNLYANKPRITQVMQNHFLQREALHRQLVSNNLLLMRGYKGLNPELAQRADSHDLSKQRSDTEQQAYCYLDWQFACQQKGINVIYPEAIQQLIQAGKQHHNTTNRHHPEAHQSINSMSLLDLIEMVCDWTALSQELQQNNGSCKQWALDNLNNRWQPDKKTRQAIFEIIEALDNRLKTIND